jgi:hypothetical protein
MVVLPEGGDKRIHAAARHDKREAEIAAIDREHRKPARQKTGAGRL